MRGTSSGGGVIAEERISNESFAIIPRYIDHIDRDDCSFVLYFVYEIIGNVQFVFAMSYVYRVSSIFFCLHIVQLTRRNDQDSAFLKKTRSYEA